MVARVRGRAVNEDNMIELDFLGNWEIGSLPALQGSACIRSSGHYTPYWSLLTRLSKCRFRDEFINVYMRIKINTRRMGTMCVLIVVWALLRLDAAGLI